MPDVFLSHGSGLSEPGYKEVQSGRAHFSEAILNTERKNEQIRQEWEVYIYNLYSIITLLSLIGVLLEERIIVN